jgi:eight-cysteine-cluster-containing protein
MSKKFLILVIGIIIIAGGGFLLFVQGFTQQNQQVTEKKVTVFDEENLPIEIRDMTKVPVEYYSGSSKYSQGECQQDAECLAAGCNLEICTSDKNIVTTCEIDGATPDKTKYACGCIKDTCGWYPIQ